MTMMPSETITNRIHGSSSHNEQRLSLLSLDGGGIRGLSALYVLKMLMAEINSKQSERNLNHVKPCDVFDLIGGISTGGLIAIMLGRLQMDVDECIVTYLRLMKSVFESSAFTVDWTGCAKGRFDVKVLEKEMKAAITATGHAEFELFNNGVNRKCKVFVCAISAETKMISQLRSYNLFEQNKSEITIWEAALATSATSSCFDNVTIGSRVYTSGDTGVNNPVNLVTLEAQNIWCLGATDMTRPINCLLSLGVGRFGGNFRQERALKLVEKTLRAITREADHAAEEFRSREKYSNRYFRFAVDCGLDEVGLAEYRKPISVKAATKAYINSLDQKHKWNNCVMNLYENRSRSIKTFSSIVAHLRVKLSQGVNHWGIPDSLDCNFVGRETEINELERMLTARVGSERVAAITGLGGMGKTQLAIEYCNRFREKQRGDFSVFWVNAASKMGLEQSYLEIGKMLQIPGIENEDANVKRLVTARLSEENRCKWLLIIDNVDDLSVFPNRIDCYNPFSSNGSIIVTTRNRNTALAVTKAQSSVLEVEEMSKSDAKMVLKRTLFDEVSDDVTSNQLLELLGYMPLALVQAAEYMNEANLSIQEYIMTYEDSEPDTIDSMNVEYDGNRKCRKTMNSVFTTWFTSFTQIQKDDKLAVDYLAFMAFIGWNAIPESLLPAAKAHRAKSHALETLKAYSFIKLRAPENCDGYERLYNMHRLVHLALRRWLRLQGEFAEYGKKTIEHIADAFRILRPESTTTWQVYLPHARYILEASDLPIEGQQAKLVLLDKVAFFLSKNGKHTEAYLFYLQHVADLEKEFDPKKLMTLQNAQQLASNLSDQNYFCESDSISRRVVDCLRETLGLENGHALRILALLAMVLEEQGKYNESEELCRAVLDVKIIILGPEHAETLDSLNNLAILYEKQGRYEQALGIHRKVLEVREKILGTDHLDTLQSLDNLAVALGWQIHYRKMEDMHRRMREEKKERLGSAFQDLGCSATMIERQTHKKVEAMHRRVLEVRQSVLGMEHPDTLVSLNNLGSIIYDQGRFIEAEKIYKQVVDARIKVLGEKHRNVLNSLNNLGIVYGHLGKHELAVQIHRRVLEQRCKDLGLTHPHTSQSYLHLAAALKALHRYREAEKLAVRALHGFLEVLGPEHPNTRRCQTLLERIRKAQNIGLVVPKVEMDE